MLGSVGIVPDDPGDKGFNPINASQEGHFLDGSDLASAFKRERNLLSAKEGTSLQDEAPTLSAPRSPRP
jgi:hypothetical protein